jgi:hypothetical protein
LEGEEEEASKITIKENVFVCSRPRFVNYFFLSGAIVMSEKCDFFSFPCFLRRRARDEEKHPKRHKPKLEKPIYRASGHREPFVCGLLK